MLFAILSLAADPRSTAFPPGWNGLAMTPPMGWRSWNAFGNRITQSMMMEAARALTTARTGLDDNASLCDIGYCSVGVDEGWENCSGVNASAGMRQHDSAGLPLIDHKSFPDTQAMVQEIHALGLAAGWYLNGCKCGEHKEKEMNYAGDIKDLHTFGFDGVKIDGCGAQRNQTLYAALMRDSGKNYTIENCHWGRCTPSDDSSCPTRTWCPFNWYRSSGDINAGASSWLSNLQTTIRFQDYKEPLSQPGCWAYPDMLEVGRVREPAKGAFYTWNRAHFGAWCVTSAPLILGMALTDTILEPVLDVIGNKEAIAINQAWDGHPGTLIEAVYAPPIPYSPTGASVPSDSPGDFELYNGASITPAGKGRADNETSGSASIRTGGPGQTSLIGIGTGLLAPGYVIDQVDLSFRYLAGYTPAKGSTKKAATARVVLMERDSKKVLKALLTTPPLGEYSWDVFKGYGPRIEVHAKGVNVPNDVPVTIALQVTNNQRNLQIPVDDLGGGFGVEVKWAKPKRSVEEVEAKEVEETIAIESMVAAEGHGYDEEDEEQVEIDPFTVGARAGVSGQGQLWAKRIPGGGAAALLINASPQNLTHSLNLTKLNMSSSIWNGYSVRDVWAHKYKAKATSETYPLTVAPFDSAFLFFSPLV